MISTGKQTKWFSFYLALTANGFSLIGNSISVIAIPWFVFDITGSAFTTAAIVVAGQLPNIMVGIFSGPLIDRYSASRISYICDAINAIAVILIPVFYSLQMLDTLLLTALVFFSMLLDVPAQTAKNVIFARLISSHKLPRARANGLVSMTETLSDLVGPLVAGLMLSVVSALYLLYIDSATFVIAALILIWMSKRQLLKQLRYPQKIQLKPANTWRWLVAQKLILKLAIFDLVINTVAVSMLSLTLPVIAKATGDQAVWLGVWLTMFAAGTTTTTLIYTVFGDKLSNLQLLIATPIAQSLALGCIALAIANNQGQWLVAVGLFIYGLALGVGGLIDASMLQKLVPESRQGTIFALFNSLRYAAVPIGILLSGWCLDQLMYTGLFVAFATITLMTAVLWLFGDNSKAKC